MTSWVENAIGDLLAVPGLRGLLLLDAASAPRMYRLDHEVSREAVDSIARGISQVVRRLGDTAARIELRYEQGRFYIQALHGGLVVALLTDPRPNLPLLSLSLETLVQAAATDRDKVLETFRASELLRLRAMQSGAPPASRAPSLRPSDDVASGAAAASLASLGMATGARASVNPRPSASPFAMPSVAPTAPEEEEAPAPPAVIGAARTHGELAALLTRISAAAARYLGRSVIANYWRQSQRDAAKDLFESRQDGSIGALAASMPVDGRTHRIARDWALTFVERCALIVVDIRDGLVGGLDDDARALIDLGSTNGSQEDA